MNMHENDLIELGSVSAETRGMWHVGSEDVSTGERIFIGGLGTED